MTKNLLLCGCGWLGYQLLSPAISQRIQVYATRRNKQKINDLNKKGATACHYELGGTFPVSLVPNCEDTTAIIMLPPGRKNGNIEQWETNILALISELIDANIAHIIFISSTSVYGDSHNGEITEASSLCPETTSAKAHVKVELYLQQHYQDNVSIVRLAGLIGPDRHPIKSLSGRALTAPNKITNLVHSHDVVAGLLALVNLGPTRLPLLFCSTSHPQRKAYYDQSANAFNLVPASFSPDSDDLEDIGKRVNGEKSWAMLGLTPTYPSPYDMLPK
ncbi:NAD(P)H-binding protein [Alteromonas sp. 5E99-2]|uniref:NAD-dependent epimerase/dehydratase family protein n=1 Tax=Alteromonas sp. 5E99-2 TaxID=2817683 RepID=UPI001A98C5B5|nr:NAD(P)H-binding protein [Alteromonas sp. 5E99-2]MBO1254513.1 NAD(P)H-binding protein [Alteromonas sp. 5E99-2]